MAYVNPSRTTYRRNPRRSGLGDVSAAATQVGNRIVKGDRPTIVQAQRSEARTLFGDSNVPIAGRTAPGSPREPRLSNAYARKLLDYWIDDSTRVYQGMSVLDQIFLTAHARPYIDNIGTMQKLRSDLLIFEPSDAQLLAIWSAVGQANVTGFAIATTPTPWQLAAEALHESVPKLPSGDDLLNILKWGFAGVVALIIL